MNISREHHANPLAEDLNAVLAGVGPAWDDLRGQRVFVTGGTGFYGCWLLETFLWANEHRDLGAAMTVLTRSPEAFRAKAPHLASHPAITLHAGDVQTFAFPEGEFPFVIHAAMEASATLLADAPLTMLDTIVGGTRHALEFARQAGTRRFLYASSGAVYGDLPRGLDRVSEEYSGGPSVTDWRSAHAEGKRMAEMLCTLYCARYGVETVSARAFALVGPYLPLDIHFAMGNFIRNGLCGETILIKGDGTPVRSYLYASDLAVWLWTMLLRGKAGEAYNLGSEEGISIADLARAVAACFDPAPGITIAGQPQAMQLLNYYVPSTARARAELGLAMTVPLTAAIEKTIAWNRRERR